MKHLIILAGAVLAVGALAVSASGCRKQSQSATASRAPKPKDGQSSNLAEELHVLLAQNRDTVLNISHSVIAKTDLIQVGVQPTAGFSCTPIRGFIPLIVTCVDESSNGTETTWDFGDGTTATGPDPSHEYTTAGNFVIGSSVIGSPSGER